VRYYTQQYGLKHTIVRYANVYGTGYTTRHLHPIHYFVAMLLERRRPVIREKGTALQDHIFIDDVVRANLCLLKRGENQTLHISSGQGATLNQIYRETAQELESHLEPIYLPGGSQRESDIVLDNQHARQSLGWQPEISLHEGIQLTIERMRERQPQVPPPAAQSIPVISVKTLATAVETTLTPA
jgi:UDP-glucose 4-epimerase